MGVSVQRDALGLGVQGCAMILRPPSADGPEPGGAGGPPFSRPQASTCLWAGRRTFSEAGGPCSCGVLSEGQPGPGRPPEGAWGVALTRPSPSGHGTPRTRPRPGSGHLPPPCARPPPSALQRERHSRRRKGQGLGQGPWSAASKTLTLAKCPPIEPPVTPVLGPRRSGCRVSCLSGPVFTQAEGLGDGGRTQRVLLATSPCWKTPGTSQSPPPSGAPAAHPLCRAVPAAPPAVDRRSPPWHVQRPRGLKVPLDTLTPSAAQGTIWWAANCVKSHPSGPRIPRHSLPCSVKPGVGVRAHACAHTRANRPAPESWLSLSPHSTRARLNTRSQESLVTSQRDPSSEFSGCRALVPGSRA